VLLSTHSWQQSPSIGIYYVTFNFHLCVDCVIRGVIAVVFFLLKHFQASNKRMDSLLQTKEEKEAQEKLRLDTIELIRNLDSDSMQAFLDSPDYEHIDAIIELLEASFVQLEKQLQLPNVTYLNIMGYGFDDFAAHQENVRLLLRDGSMHFDENELPKYHQLIDQYNLLIPRCLREFRSKLRDILRSQKQLKKKANLKSPIEYQMATFELVDLK